MAHEDEKNAPAHTLRSEFVLGTTISELILLLFFLLLLLLSLVAVVVSFSIKYGPF